MKFYKFWTKTDSEGIREYEIQAESCKEAYEILLNTGYSHNEIYQDRRQIGV